MFARTDWLQFYHLVIRIPDRDGQPSDLVVRSIGIGWKPLHKEQVLRRTIGQSAAVRIEAKLRIERMILDQGTIVDQSSMIGLESRHIIMRVTPTSIEGLVL